MLILSSPKLILITIQARKDEVLKYRIYELPPLNYLKVLKQVFVDTIIFLNL